MDGINSRLDITEEKITELENIAIEAIQNKIMRENFIKWSIGGLCDNFKQAN